MKYPGYIYAKALSDAIAGAENKSAAEREKIAENFIAMVRRNGDEMHLPKILEEAARFVRGKRGIHKVTIESARPLKPEQKKSLRQFIKEGDVVEEHINPELIAGVKIIVNDERQFDGSLKGKLDKLFGTS